MAKSVKEQLIKQLALGQFISGQAIGDELGISRAAVSKHIRGIQDMGLDVFCVTGKGYRFAQPLRLLDKTEIMNNLLVDSIAIQIEVHSVIDSTNSYLLRRIPHQVKQGQVCVAEFQNSGRGRRGRQWISPFGSHIYMSMYWCLEQGISAAMGLSVVAALAVSDSIYKLYNVDVELKWPNDIYANGKKLAGILIELEGQALESSHCVIGIGLNINMPAKAAEDIDQPWTDLQTVTSGEIDRNHLVSTLIQCLIVRLNQHKVNGIITMLDDWFKQDLYLNKPVRLITGEKETLGICRGINNQGALLLEVDRQVKPIYGGEVSLRGLL